jgi:TPP-dependent pyruvate/acetoin dehydrogenase alpha subunit
VTATVVVENGPAREHAGPRMQRLVELRELIDVINDINSHSPDLFDETVLHLARGQEAVSVALEFAHGQGDVLFSTHRGIEHALAWGLKTHSVLAESLGRVGGTAFGRSGHMHLIDMDHNFGGTNAIVGGNLPLAVGMALALKRRGLPNVCFAMMGDGAANTGQFHESLNAAAIWSLPVLFVCENNGWAEMTPAAEVTAGESLAVRVSGFGVRTLTANGLDVDDIEGCLRSARQYCLSESSPAFVEIAVPRHTGHFVGDIQHYRTQALIDNALSQDCVESYAEKHEFSHADLTKLRADANSIAINQMRAALNATMPTREHVLSQPDDQRKE